MPTKRRIRVKRNPANTVTPAKKLVEMKDKVKDIESIAAHIMELQEQIREGEGELLTFMEAYKVQVVEGTYGDYLHDIPPGKSTTIIPVAELYSRMDHDDFLTVVKPQVTEVKKYFSPKELEGFSEIVPGKPGQPRVKYKPHKK